MRAVRGALARRALVAALGATSLGHAAWACGEALGADALRQSDANYTLVMRSTPHPVVVGRHFVLDLAVCPGDGVPAPDALRVDAHMPEHRHGMNYQPSVRATGPGRYRAEGLLFHMPGRWELVVELRSGDTRTARLIQPMRID